MADHRALGRLGWVFGAVTAAVLLTAALAYQKRPPGSAGVAVEV